MTQETIFNGQETPDPVVSNTTNTETLPPEVVEFVGSGKKYSSVEEALKSVPHAQKHIQTLEQELVQIKEELTKRKTTEELLDEIKSGVSTGEKTSTVEIPQDKLVATVTQVLAQKEIEKTAKQNISTVISSFSSIYGEKAEEKFILLAQETGLTVPQLNSLSASSPQAVLKLAGIAPKQENIPGKTQSTINTESASSGKTTELSARIPKAASTKDLVAAWKVAGEKVKQSQSKG